MKMACAQIYIYIYTRKEMRVFFLYTHFNQYIKILFNLYAYDMSMIRIINILKNIHMII